MRIIHIKNLNNTMLLKLGQLTLTLKIDKPNNLTAPASSKLTAQLTTSQFNRIEEDIAFRIEDERRRNEGRTYANTLSIR